MKHSPRITEDLFQVFFFFLLCELGVQGQNKDDQGMLQHYIHYRFSIIFIVVRFNSKLNCIKHRIWLNFLQFQRQILQVSVCTDQEKVFPLSLFIVDFKRSSK